MEKNKLIEEVENIVEKMKQDNEKYNLKKKKIKDYINNYFNILSTNTMYSVEEVEEFYNSQYNYANFRLLKTMLLYDINKLYAETEKYIDEEVINSIFENFKSSLKENLKIFSRGILRNYFEEDGIPTMAESLVNSGSLNELLNRLYGICANKKIRDKDPEKNAILNLFVDQLEEYHDHNSKEYRSGIDYYFKMKDAKNIKELNYIYETAGNELFMNPPVDKPTVKK